MREGIYFCLHYTCLDSRLKRNNMRIRQLLLAAMGKMEHIPVPIGKSCPWNCSTLSVRACRLEPRYEGYLIINAQTEQFEFTQKSQSFFRYKH